ncbi:MAG: threonylcarbamoyl-AMP synthase [Saprospiraceae bacterium]|nr:threonylcarbamoyl-AMP synthase [Saprospiraceae bacterium]
MIGMDLSYAKQQLVAGELVAIPTETVYGLAANALASDAVAKIFDAKDRPSFDPLIVHTNSWDRVQEWVQDIPELAHTLAATFMPGPLTLLLPKKPIIPDLVTAGLSRVGIRLPSHPMTQSLLATLDFPVAAPSANPFGYISPTTAQHVDDQLGNKVSYILDGGPCQVGVESTIVSFEEGRAIILRKGGTPIEAIEAAIGPVQVQAHSTSNPQAPGMLKSHYAPKIPFLLGDLPLLIEQQKGKRLGILCFSQQLKHSDIVFQKVLSPSRNLSEAAQRLFAAMREMDQMDLDIILAEYFPEEGLGRAINDRLSRAAAR